MARRMKPADAAARASAESPVIPVGRAVDLASLMPGYRVRHDGWTRERTQRFLDTLAHTGCVRDACRVADVSDTSAYRLKDRYPAFAFAWSEALARSRIGLEAVAYRRAVEGRETVIIRKGEEVERRISPSDSMLALLIKRGDLAEQRAQEVTAGLAEGKVLYHAHEVVNYEEWVKGWRFDDAGRKSDMFTRERIFDRLEARFAEMRARQLAYEELYGDEDGEDGEDDAGDGAISPA
jgi:hypothetical protein